MCDKESIRREIASLGLPAIVLEIFDGHSSRDELAYRCQSPFKSVAEGSGFPSHLLPLWECGTMVTVFDTVSQSFSKFSLEAPDEARLSGVSFNQVVADLLTELWEDEVDDNNLSELAVLFHHRGR